MNRPTGIRSRFTRRQLLGGAASLGGTLVGGAVLGTGLSGCLPPTADAAAVDPNAHPLDGLLSFDGLPLPAPELLGRVTVVDFWASWCGPCRQAFRYLDQLYRTYVSDGLYVLGVSVDENAQAGQGFLARHRPRFDTAWDGKGAVAARFGVATLPTTLLLDKAGTLIHRQQGFDIASHRVLEAHVRRLVDSL